MRTNFRLNAEIPANQLANLKQLREYLIKIKTTHTFDMRVYTSVGAYDCNTDCCMVGHAYHAGIGSLPLARPQLGVFYDFDFAEFIDRELVPSELKLSFKEAGNVIRVNTRIKSFLFRSENPNCFDQAIARLDIVINQDWHKLKFDHPNADYIFIDYSHHYPISGT
jgi:hypothetical protein